MLVCASLTTNRRLEVGPVASVAASVRPIRVPSCRGPGTSLRLHRTCGDTSRGVRSSGECAAASGAMGEGGYKLREAGNLSLELLDLWDRGIGGPNRLWGGNFDDFISISASLARSVVSAEASTIRTLDGRR